MVREKRFEFLEHTADAYIAAYGQDLAEAFENAASAMFDVMTDLEQIKPEFTDIIEVEGADEFSLLYNWLEALLVNFDIDGKLYSHFNIVDLNKDTGEFHLRAEVAGETFNPRKHPQKVGVKAVTYHLMEILTEPGKTTLKFILDL